MRSARIPTVLLIVLGTGVTLSVSYLNRVEEIATAAHAADAQPAPRKHRDESLEGCLDWLRQVRATPVVGEPFAVPVIGCSNSIHLATEAELATFSAELERLHAACDRGTGVGLGLLGLSRVDGDGKREVILNALDRLRAVFAWREADELLEQLAAAGPDMPTARPTWLRLKPRLEAATRFVSRSPVDEMFRGSKSSKRSSRWCRPTRC